MYRTDPEIKWNTLQSKSSQYITMLHLEGANITQHHKSGQGRMKYQLIATSWRYPISSYEQSMTKQAACRISLMFRFSLPSSPLKLNQMHCLTFTKKHLNSRTFDQLYINQIFINSAEIHNHKRSWLTMTSNVYKHVKCL